MGLRIAVFVVFLSTVSATTTSGPDLAKLEAIFQRIIGASRAEVGAALIHLESGALFEIRGHERFPMASVCKLPIALELLSQVAEQKLTLDDVIWIAASDIRPCCTLSRRHPNGAITRTARELLELMIIESDNTAADAVLKLVGGPAVVERRLRALGFHKINMNRYEGDMLLDMAGVIYRPPREQWTLELQRRLVAEVSRDALIEGQERYLRDERDTATPYEMALFVGRLQLGNLLPPSYSDLLLDLMARSTTGPNRIKRQLPAGTVVAHKTGTTNTVINDVGIITLPPGSAIGGHVVLSVFVKGGGRLAGMERSIARLGAAAYEFFTGTSLTPPKAPRRSRRR